MLLISHGLSLRVAQTRSSRAPLLGEKKRLSSRRSLAGTLSFAVDPDTLAIRSMIRMKRTGVSKFQSPGRQTPEHVKL